MKSREEYIDKLAAQLKEWSGKIDELEAKARTARAEAKAGYEHQIKQLTDKRDTAAKRLQELRDASGEAWEALKVGAEAAWTDLRKSVAEAKEKFNKPGGAS